MVFTAGDGDGDDAIEEKKRRIVEAKKKKKQLKKLQHKNKHERQEKVLSELNGIDEQDPIEELAIDGWLNAFDDFSS